MLMPAMDRKIVVLGAGITGLTVAWELSRTFPGRVVLLEKEAAVGGLAATFTRDQLAFDTGSHRLHEGYHPEVDQLIRDLCGPDLLKRDRKGLIFIQDRPFRYPPSAFDIMSAFGLTDFLRFSLGFLRARLERLVRRREPDNFEDYTTAKVGRSLYDRFYKPYALKLYGMSPRAISKDPAVSRVRKFAASTMFQDLKRRLLGQNGKSYLYPSQGIGQLSTVLQERFLDNGGQLVFISQIDDLRIKGDRLIESVAWHTRDGVAQEVATDLFISTIPLDVLHHLVRLESDALGRPRFDLQWRSLRLLYLITPDKVPSENETFYFPEPHILFGRVSELHKYSPALNSDPERTMLTIEIPCSLNDELWNMTDERLAELCTLELQKLGILRQPTTGKAEFFSRKVRNVYPIYDLGWKERFDKIYERLNGLENLYMIGRTALFLHCNIDHCMLMALKLAQYLSNGYENKKEWDAIRQDFFNYRVRE
jgi:protoporphyrinogen oxidase